MSGDVEKETLGFSLIYNKLKMQSFQTVLHDVIGVWDWGWWGHRLVSTEQR